MSDSKRRRGCQLVILAGLITAAIAVYDYGAVSTGIDHSGGVLLVLGSSLLLVFGALMALVFNAGMIAAVFMILVVLDILGTGFAAYMLESGLIMGSMALAMVGWILRVANRMQGRAS